MIPSKHGLGNPIHRGVAEAAEKTQRKEGGNSPHLFSLRFLCGLCDSAVNWVSWIETIKVNC